MAVAARREARARGLDLRLVLGLGIALAAFLVGIMVYSSGRPETMPVLVAARDLPQGTLIGDADLRVEQVPVSQQLRGVLMADRAQVVGKVTARPVGTGEPIVASVLTQGLPRRQGRWRWPCRCRTASMSPSRCGRGIGPSCMPSAPAAPAASRRYW